LKSVGTTISAAINRPNFQKRYSVELNNARKRFAAQKVIFAVSDPPHLVDKPKIEIACDISHLYRLFKRINGTAPLRNDRQR
jgi:hypothetical protein